MQRTSQHQATTLVVTVVTVESPCQPYVQEARIVQQVLHMDLSTCVLRVPIVTLQDCGPVLSVHLVSQECTAAEKVCTRYRTSFYSKVSSYNR